ncbi:hypothetical protein [Accumulibacter sp.]|uniref:hypothetical protein n=1 Tax=Accumulibacter sp. TaxID=2053492 RepID=UPI002628165B|nr:hypothetical protein [Accumulibacter sp.]
MIVFYALSWFLVFGLLALWSLAAWALHAVAVWSVSNASALTGVTSGVEGLRLSQLVPPWVPPEIAQAMTALLAGFAPVVESLLQTVPALTSGLTMVTWVIWGLGSALLLLLGAGLHLVIAMWRRHSGGFSPQPASRLTA